MAAGHNAKGAVDRRQVVQVQGRVQTDQAGAEERVIHMPGHIAAAGRTGAHVDREELDVVADQPLQQRERGVPVDQVLEDRRERQQVPQRPDLGMLFQEASAGLLQLAQIGRADRLRDEDIPVVVEEGGLFIGCPG